VEKKQLERAMGFEDLVKEARWAAESHRVTRQWVKTTLKEGDLMTDICERIENKTRSLLGPGASPFNCGIAFPTGCSINHVAAHYSPNTGDTTRLQRDDLVKFDYGTQVNPNPRSSRTAQS
jgi:methionyl aminopeptidase